MSGGAGDEGGHVHGHAEPLRVVHGTEQDGAPEGDTGNCAVKQRDRVGRVGYTRDVFIQAVGEGLDGRNESCL